MIARATFSTIWYCVSGFWRMWLVKYMGCWVLSFSWTSAELTTFVDATMYIMRGRERSGLARTGGW